MRWLRTLPVVCVTVGAFAALGACGGSSSGGSSAGSHTSGGTSVAAAGAGGEGAQAFCAEVKSQEAYLQGSAMSTLLAGGTPAAWKAYFAKTAALNQRLVDAAPSDIKPTIATLKETSTQLQDAMAAVRYDVSKLGSAKLLTLLKSPARTEASQKITSYVQTACDIDLTKVGG
jgi:hypothetical protein